MGQGQYAPKFEREIFNFLYFRWDVAKAWRLVENRRACFGVEPGYAPVAEALKPSGMIRIDRKKVEANPDAYDADVPMLAIRFPAIMGEAMGGIAIDGWHRLVKAEIEGRAEMGVVLLTEDEEIQCRITPTQSDLREMYTTQECMACGETKAQTYFRRSDSRLVCDECWEFLRESDAFDRTAIRTGDFAATAKAYRAVLEGGETLNDLRRALIETIVEGGTSLLDIRTDATALKFLEETGIADTIAEAVAARPDPEPEVTA